MIRRHMIMSAALATFALSSCNGGDDPDPTPTPSPTSTASPSPTPTASPTYTAFPLSAAVEFTTINAGTSYTGDPATGAVTLGVAGTEMRSERVRLATSNAITTATYVIRENTEESRFVNANVTTAPAPSTTEFVFRTNGTTAGQFAQLEFLNNTIPSQVTSDAALQLTNVSYANWWRGDSTAGQKRITSTVFGYQTFLSDMPTTGTAAYNVRVTGRLVSVSGATTTVVRVSGTATANVNFSTGLVDLTLNLTTPTGAGGASVAYGTFTAQGAIATGNNQFTGSFGQTSPLAGTIAGGFFGSQAKEIGITFAGSGTFNGANQRLVGVVVGKK